jgi:hypothetical protein
MVGWCGDEQLPTELEGSLVELAGECEAAPLEGHVSLSAQGIHQPQADLGVRRPPGEEGLRGGRRPAVPPSGLVDVLEVEVDVAEGLVELGMREGIVVLGSRAVAEQCQRLQVVVASGAQVSHAVVVKNLSHLQMGGRELRNLRIGISFHLP